MVGQLTLDNPAVGTLRNYRQGRYRGDDFCVPVSEFAKLDQDSLFETYEFLERLLVTLKHHDANASAETLAQVQSCVSGEDTNVLLSRMRLFGVASLNIRSDELMAKTIHDLRGGAMSALLGELQMSTFRPLNADSARRLFFLTRDHLKIMRNALLGLDDVKRQADLVPKMHSVDLILKKWQYALPKEGERPTRLDVACDYHGNIAECCVEFGALDRVLYNLVNNACRHTESGQVKLLIRSQPENLDEPESLRFCISNPVSAQDERSLAARGDLNVLFSPGVSSTGSGYGLTVAIDFVTNAFGLSGRARALDGGYLGAELVGNEFRVWFHWPVVIDI